MRTLRNLLITVLLVVLAFLIYDNRVLIVQNLSKTLDKGETIVLPDNPTYKNNFEFEFVKETDDFTASSRQEILDILYTVLNNGLDNFTFYCDQNYGTCVSDFNEISQDQVLLSTINNMVSPFNSYDKISFTIAAYGKIDMEIQKLYSDEEITRVDNEIERLITENLGNKMSDRDKIKFFHDYLINNSKYDQDRATAIENGSDIDNNSHKAIGPLFDKIALCSGYSDAMKLFLDKLEIPNYKISNTRHSWNLVYVDGKWLHLDLTWDDPVTDTGVDLLLHKFFLITTDELQDLDATEHNFNAEYYPEAEKA